MNRPVQEDYIVVIRSNGERTKEACISLVSKQVPSDRIQVIDVEPFEAAIRECYRLGIESGKSWMITIDADVLVRDGFAEKLLDYTAGIDDKMIMFNGLIYDKIFMTYRRAGLKVYRTRYLEEAMGQIPEAGTQVRPEAYILRQMVRRGYRKRYFDTIVGIHDFEQYYRDIYRKCFLHANKHRDELLDLLSKWKQESFKDSDYTVVIKGAFDGLTREESAKTDARMYRDLAGEALKALGVEEKEPLATTDLSERVEETLKHAGPYRKKRKIDKLNTEYRKRGVLGTLFWAAGSFFLSLSRKLSR